MKKRILIYGKVHNVGYRPLLLGIAESLEIERFYADNVTVEDREAVEILIEADKEKINRFIDLIKTKKPEKAYVEDIKVYDYEGHIMKTESYYRYLTSLQLFTIATYGGYMLEKQDSMLNKQDSMLEKQDSMLEKQDKMLEKQDLMLGKMDKMLEKQDKMLEKQDLMVNKQDLMLKKQDDMLGKMDLMIKKQDETIREIRALREDLKAYMDERFRKLEEEIKLIKEKLGLL